MEVEEFLAEFGVARERLGDAEFAGLAHQIERRHNVLLGDVVKADGAQIGRVAAGDHDWRYGECYPRAAVGAIVLSSPAVLVNL